MATVTSSIFRDPRPRTSPYGENRSVLPPKIAIRPATAPVAPTSDGRLIAILDAPIPSTETALAGYQRKEHELGSLFASLSVLECCALHARLSQCKPGDELANKFARLTLERRGRLLTFLADARRREAIAATRR